MESAARAGAFPSVLHFDRHSDQRGPLGGVVVSISRLRAGDGEMASFLKTEKEASTLSTVPYSSSLGMFALEGTYEDREDLGGAGGPSASAPQGALEEATEHQRQDREVRTAATTFSGEAADVGSVAGSASSHSQEESPCLKPSVPPEETVVEARGVVEGTSLGTNDSKTESSLSPTEKDRGSPCWEGEAVRRTRPPRRAAAAAAAAASAASTRKQVEEEAPSLALRPSLAPRVASRLPGVKYCHSRNAWIARWSEEGQERWKTFSVKACKGFTEARIQAVKFRWEKVRMKYAKLMKQATPQPGLIGAGPVEEGSGEALEMDTEAAELAAALQMYGNGSLVRLPRSRNGGVSGTQKGRSRSPSNVSGVGLLPAGAANGRPPARQKRQAGVPAEAALEETSRSTPNSRALAAKKLCSGAVQQQLQMQEQQEQHSQGGSEQLTASQWALLQQHLPLQARRGGKGSNTTSGAAAAAAAAAPPASGWTEQEKAVLPAAAAAALQMASAHRSAAVKGDVEEVEKEGGKASDVDLRAQLFLHLAKRLQRHTEHQDASLMLRALKNLLPAWEDSAGRGVSRLQQEVRFSACNRGHDLETELHRFASNSCEHGGGLTRRACCSSSPQSNKERNIPTQAWGDSLGESIPSFSRFLAEDSWAAGVGVEAAASDKASRAVGATGSVPQWIESPLNGSARPIEPSGGILEGTWSPGVPVECDASGGDLQPWRRAVCVILEDVLENCILEVGSQHREGSSLSQERLQFAPVVGRLKAQAARSCSKAELRPFLRLFSRSIRLGIVPSKQSEDMQQLILDALGALDDALAVARGNQQGFGGAQRAPSLITAGATGASTSPLLPAGNNLN